MIGGTRIALLAACALGAVPAMAASPQDGHYVWVPPGAAVVLVPVQRIAPVDVPIARMIAQQDAMMRRMFADMDALMAMPLPDPAQMIRSVMQGMPQGVPGSSVVMTSITTPQGTCSQTITYGAPGRDGRPIVHASSRGDACGAMHVPATRGVTQTGPAVPMPVAPPQSHQNPRLWTVSNPPQPIALPLPRT